MDTPKPKKRGFQDPDHCQRCGAQLRRGGGRLCRKPAEVNARTGKRLRCRLHGSKTTGPKTAKGKKRVSEAARATFLKHSKRSKAYLEARKALNRRLTSLTTKRKGLK